MATTQLSDIYNPLTFGRRIQEAQIEKNAFYQAGIVASDPLLQAQVNQGGNIGELTQFAALGMNEPNYSSDDPAVKSTPKKIGSQKMQYRLASRNESWSVMDLARELNHGSDPVGAITSRVGSFWATDNQSRLIHSCNGILADNVANNGGDMVVDVATDASGAIGAGEKISSGLILDAAQTLGDRGGDIAAMAIHSVVYNELMKQQLIQFVRDADNNVTFATYMGKRVVVDDGLPVEMGTNRPTYTSILFGGALFAHASGAVQTPSEVFRNPDAGNGGGEEILYSRVSDALHPNGFSFTSASVAGNFATYAELANAANWTRVHDRKNVPLAFLKTNG